MSNYPRPIWFSFSGGDKLYVLKLISSVLDNNKQSDFQIDPKSYLEFKDHADTKEIDLDKITYKLKLGEDVLDLVDVIAMFPRRLLVLSPNYFKSEYCLLELACSLIVSKGSNLAFLTLDFDKDIFNEKIPINLEVSVGLNKKEEISGHYHLAELLALIYEKIIGPFLSPVFHFSESVDPLSEFGRFLIKTKARLYLVGFDGDSEEILNNNAIQLESYSKSIDASVFEGLKNNYDDFYEQSKENFLGTPFGCWCKDNYLNSENQNKIFSGIDLNELRDFADFIESKFDKSDALKSKDIALYSESVKSLCALLILTTINAYWATDMRLASRNGLRIKLAYSAGNMDEKILFCQIAAEAINHSLPRLELVKEETLSVKNYLCITELPKAREEVKSTDWFNELTFEIVNRLLPGQYNSSSDLAKILNDNKAHVATDIRTDLYLNRQYGDDGIITDFRILIKPDSFGSGQNLTERQWETTVKQMMDILNTGAEASEKIKFGLVVLHAMKGGNNVLLVSTNQHQMTIRKIVQKILKVFL